MLANKGFFIGTFVLVVLSRAIALCEFRQYVPYTLIYLIYISWWFILAIYDRRLIVNWKRNKSFLAVFSLLIYFVIFAFSNIAVLDVSDVMTNLVHSVLMVLFVCVSAYWIIRFDCLHEIIKSTYLAFALFMTTLLIIYLPRLNIGLTITNFWHNSGAMRNRVLFSFIANNIAAEHAFSVILMSLYVINTNKKKKHSVRNAIIIVDDFLMGIIIIANNSRGTLATAILLLLVYAFVYAVKKNGLKKVVRITVIVAIAIVIVLIIYVRKTGRNLIDLLYFTNRMHFVSNFKILEKSGRWLLGIGRTTGAYLASHNTLYGLKTDYMEIYYIGVFIQTGILGSIWIIVILYVVGSHIFKKYKEEKSFTGKWMFVVFYYSLVLSVFEDYVLSSLYITSICFLTFILAYCNSKEHRERMLENKV